MRIKSSSRPQRPLILPHLLGGHRVCKDRLRQADETFVAKQPTCRFLFRTFATWLTHNASTVPCFPLLPFNFPLAYVLSSTSSATPNAGSLFSCSGRERVDRDLGELEKSGLAARGGIFLNDGSKQRKMGTPTDKWLASPSTKKRNVNGYLIGTLRCISIRLQRRFNHLAQFGNGSARK